MKMTMRSMLFVSFVTVETTVKNANRSSVNMMTMTYATTVQNMRAGSVMRF